MTLVYCYGVVEESPKLNKKGFESQRIYTIPYRDISAVVSEVSKENFSQEIIDEKIRDMQWLALNAQIHEDVVDYVMEKTTIIPMKFCTIFKTRKKLVSILEGGYAEFRLNLKQLRGKREMGVKIYFDPMPLQQRIREESPDVRELEKEARQKSPGAAYFIKQKIDILVEERMHQNLAEERKRIFDKIKILSEDAKQKKLLNKKLTGRDMLLNAVFLIKKPGLTEFKREVKEIMSKHPLMEFEVWGPFPPYNFVG